MNVSVYVKDFTTDRKVKLNNHDHIMHYRSLLERCLGAESELDRSRSSLIELRRKLDDSQAALHELGRENQSIQV